MSSAFSPAFLRGEERAHAFLPDDFRHAERRAEHARRAGTRSISSATLDALKAQASSLPPSRARDESLAALGRPGTAVVVTGQQVGLFLGPLYSFYKAASAVLAARALQAETGVRCVPVFWLQSEDHDFDEIAHCDVQAADGALVRLQLAAPHHVPRTSLSGLALGAGVEQSLAQLASALESLPHAEEVLALFRRHYRPEHTWVGAFAGVMAELFEELVILDPRDERLATQVLPLHQRAVQEAPAIARALLERHEALERAGFTAQVHVRPDAPLCFFHPQGADGPRYRLEPREGCWGLVGQGETVTTEQLLQGPFSTSALLRPLVQDTLLPTAAYVGGPGELNYFAQLSPLYAHFGVPMPMFVPRARFRVLDPRVRSLLETLGVTAADVEAPREDVLRRLTGLSEPVEDGPAKQPVSSAVAPSSTGSDRPELELALMQAVEPILSAIPTRPGSDSEDAVKRTRATIARAASRLAGRVSRERLRADQVLLDRVERLQRALFPHGEPQERVLGLPGFAARYGVANFTALVTSQLEPFAAALKEVSP